MGAVLKTAAGESVKIHNISLREPSTDSQLGCGWTVLGGTILCYKTSNISNIKNNKPIFAYYN